MTHEELCERGRRWLHGTRRCHPVFSNIASCDEIPDAIGWSSTYKWHGSTVIECKTSVSDFYADQKKRQAWKHLEHGWIVNKPWSEEIEKFEKIEVPLMGDFRFYLCEPDVISVELVEKFAPDHGLIYKAGQSMKMIRPAPRRALVDKGGEIRYLRFAIINEKKPYPAVNEMARL